MNEQENIIRNKFGQENHFRVPEGYFDNLKTKIMDKLPEDNRTVQRRTVRLWKPLAACAACAVGVIMSVAIYFTNNDQQAVEATAENHTEQLSEHDKYIETVADYAMMDNADIIECLNEKKQKKEKNMKRLFLTLISIAFLLLTASSQSRDKRLSKEHYQAQLEQFIIPEAQSTAK